MRPPRAPAGCGACALRPPWRPSRGDGRGDASLVLVPAGMAPRSCSADGCSAGARVCRVHTWEGILRAVHALVPPKPKLPEGRKRVDTWPSLSPSTAPALRSPSRPLVLFPGRPWCTEPSVKPCFSQYQEACLFLGRKEEYPVPSAHSRTQ